MDLVKLQQKLIAAARSQAPSDTVPYAFEKRIMARLSALPRVDALTLWTRAFWRAAASCVGIMLLLSAWTAFHPAANVSLADDLETTIVAGLNDSQGW